MKNDGSANGSANSTSNQGASGKPQVRSTPGITITSEQIALLHKAFPNEKVILVKEEFRSGYSGAVVLLVSVGAGRAPLVVKFAHPHDLQQEYDAYVEFVRQVSPQNIAHLQGEPLVSDDGHLGMIQYTFAGGESHLPTNSLQAYYEKNGAEDTSAVLNRIFRVYGRHWWANNRAESYVLDEYYDRLLPVHLQARPAAQEVEPEYTIRAGESSVLVAEKAEIGDVIQLVGLEVVKSLNDGRRLTLRANPPENEASAPLRIRVESRQTSDYNPGDTIEPMLVEVTATRMTLLGDAAKAIIPGFDPTSQQFIVPSSNLEHGESGIVLPNPLPRLQEQLYSVVETKMSVIHGDLNLQNVLVDGPTGFSWLIDFAETRYGPTLLDLQRLEVQLITKLMPGHGEIPLAALVEMMTRLHADPPLPAPPQAALQEPYTLLVTIRRLARQYLMDDLDWNEYYYGLVVALIGALKYDELDSTARKLALVCAASAESLVGTPLHTEVPNETTETMAVVAPISAAEDTPVIRSDTVSGTPVLTPPPPSAAEETVSETSNARSSRSTAPAAAAAVPNASSGGRRLGGIIVGVVAVLLVALAAVWFATQMRSQPIETAAKHDNEIALAVAATEHARESNSASNTDATPEANAASDDAAPAESDEPDVVALAVDANTAEETPSAEEEGREEPPIEVSDPTANPEVIEEAAVTPKATVPTGTPAQGTPAQEATPTTIATETPDDPQPTEETPAPTNAPTATSSPTQPTITIVAADVIAAQPTSPPVATSPSRLAATSEQTSLAPLVTLNVRSGPGTDYPVVGSLTTGTAAAIVGQTSIGGEEWYLIEFADVDAGEAWITGNPALVEKSGDEGIPRITQADLPATPEPATISSPAIPPALWASSIDGDIYYSATSDGTDGVYRVPANGGASTLVVAQALQPAVSPNGEWLAYQNTNNSSLGISAVNLQNNRTLRYSSAPEDGFPSWNSSSDEVVYSSSREGDRDSRLYRSNAGSNALSRGAEPDWHPTRDLIVFRGCDDTGSRCGLWTVSSNGSGRTALTDVSSDSRPKWSQDGKSVAFMSSNRDGNWEIYTIDVATGVIQRLTENPSIDGHPVYSPDGQSIAFLTNRSTNGAWAIQVMDVQGNSTMNVYTLPNNLPDWLSHGLDWTN